MRARIGRDRSSPLRQPWRDVEYAVVDLETTGLNLRRDSIVSYGATVIRAGRIIVSENRYGLVRPDSTVSPESMTIHGLLPSDLRGAPPLTEAVTALDEVITGRVLVAHAAWVEEAFLERAFRMSRKRLRCRVVDTAAMARAVGARAARCNGEPDLEVLATEVGVPVVSPHHALGDATTTAQVFLALATRVSRLGYTTARDLITLTAADRLWPR
ncbi:3'-5' exonuclease [Mycolicibacterium sp. S2-37]|uniref:3'-5' exonuclease n=1 Tax=Mycolicibacterium sp. S2-37 TaxID=2810297 RepID=UPI0027DA58D4|nr:3'-5' exonuclease [Mycolicibacterium sp. S2-37]